MIKMLVTFISLTIIIGVSIDIFRRLTGKEKLDVVKLLGYGAACSLVATIILLAIVILF